ncbi:MAG TPA: type II toxin-antitoxin system PemK/MazF family toxin [Caulobacteraceae bacterium]|jgi:mRNA-degrading endonuclease toxin of MazEF toxin-antitoxin module
MRRGDIYFVDLNPTEGREQRGDRPVLVLTEESFNRISPPLVAPVTTGGSFARHRGFAVDLAGQTEKVRGMVLCNQLRTLDIAARNGRFIERAPPALVTEVLARVATLIA